MDDKNVRIVIAEDDFLVCEEIKRILRGTKYEVIGVACNGEEALKMASDLNPDMIIMDIKMPKMDGLEASRLISEQCLCPIVILTAYESLELIKKASKVGVGAFLCKPPRFAELDRAATIAIARYHDLQEMSRLNRKLEVAETRLQNVFNTTIPICITSTEYQIVYSNDAYKNIYRLHEQHDSAVKCYESRPGPACHTDDCPLEKIMKGEKNVVCEPTKSNDDGSSQHFIVTARPFLNSKGELEGIVESFQDITERKKIEMERDNLIKELQQALSEIQDLRKILPICSFCKNIRNDQGYYEQIEGYFHKHTGVDFSHTICPTCAKKHYPEFIK